MSSKTLASKAALDLSAPGAIDDLLRFHKSVFGDTKMGDETITVQVPVATPAADPRQGWDEEAFLKSDAVQNLLRQAQQNARQEEKDKLYQTIEGLKSSVTELKSGREAEVQAAAEKARKEAEEAAKKHFDETQAKDLLAEAEQKWQARFDEMQAQAQAEKAAAEAMAAKEREFSDLRDYTQQVIKASEDEIAPELAHLVRGNSREEVDASLAQIKAASAAIVQSIQQNIPTPPAPAPRGVAPTGAYAAGNGPLEQITQTRTLSAQDIANMPMAEYAKLRGSLGVDRQNSYRGLFG